MVVSLHILIALASVVAATLVFFQPNKRRFILSYSLAGITLLSGLYLVLADPAHMLHVCVSGSVYLAFMFTITATAHWRFRKLQESRN